MRMNFDRLTQHSVRDKVPLQSDSDISSDDRSFNESTKFGTLIKGRRSLFERTSERNWSDRVVVWPISVYADAPRPFSTLSSMVQTVQADCKQIAKCRQAERNHYRLEMSKFTRRNRIVKGTHISLWSHVIRGDMNKKYNGARWSSRLYVVHQA